MLISADRTILRFKARITQQIYLVMIVIHPKGYISFNSDFPQFWHICTFSGHYLTILNFMDTFSHILSISETSPFHLLWLTFGNCFVNLTPNLTPGPDAWGSSDQTKSYLENRSHWRKSIEKERVVVFSIKSFIKEKMSFVSLISSFSSFHLL